MLSTLLHSFDIISKPVKKEQLLKTFNTMTSLIQDDLIASLTEVKELEKSPRVTKSDLYQVTKEVMKTDDVKSKSIFGDLENIFTQIIKNKSKIENLITKHTSTVLTNKVLSIKDAAIVKLVDDISSLVLYSTDYLTCTLADAKNTAFPKVKFKKLKEGIPAFVDFIKTYGNGKEFEKNLDKIAKLDDTVINKDSNHTFVDLKLKNDGMLDILPQGFINNPFYHIRMWLIDRDIQKLEALKDKKRLIELRIMELKIEEKSGNDGDLSKQIEYYEDKLAAIEYKIEKLEEV